MFEKIGQYKMVTTTNGTKSFLKVDREKAETAKVISLKKGEEQPLKTTAFYGGSYNATSYQQQVNFANPTSPQHATTNFLDGFVDVFNPTILRTKYKDMYYFDNICGTAADLRSELPFSDFTLSGISDPEVLRVYERSLENLKPLNLLRRLLADYFVYGNGIQSLLFDPEDKEFTGLLPLELDRCDLTDTPVLNDPPLIDYNLDDSLKAFIAKVKSGDVRVTKYLDNNKGLKAFIDTCGDDFRIPLDPELTLYIERNDLSYSPKRSVSYFARALKYYEYEKRIFRGTLDLAEKRLKSILHIMIGNDTILPNSETLGEISNAFKTANLDPTDAIVATHNYVQTNEIRTPTDFWRWDEISDFINRGKIVALGINEQFLSGEMNYASMESALSVFSEQLLWDRTYITDQVFYKTIFPYLAKQNNLKDKTATSNNKVTASNIVLGIEEESLRNDPLLSQRPRKEKDKYQIPTIMWHKALKPRVDKDWMETLMALKEQGIPIPYRMWLTAANVDVDDLLREYDTPPEEAVEIRAQKYKETFQTDESSDYQSQFEDSDFGEENTEEKNSEDLFPEVPTEDLSISEEGKEATIETPEVPLTPTTPTMVNPQTPSLKRGSSNENPQLFQGSSLNLIGLKNRKKIGDLNSDSVQSAFTPLIQTATGSRKASKEEVRRIDEKVNTILATQLAERDKQEVIKQNKEYKEHTSRRII
jgi:hypothetical protein